MKMIKTIIDQKIKESNPKRATIVHNFGINRLIIPNVYPGGPESDMLLHYYLKSYLPNAKILDYGTGSGYLAMVCAIKTNPKQIVATDSNPLAIACSKINFIYSGIEDKIDLRQCDGFEQINDKEQFDIILASLPFHKGKPTTLYESSFYDENLEMRKSLFSNAQTHLTKNGKILFTYSENANKEIPLEKCLKRNKLECKLVDKLQLNDQNYLLFEIRKNIFKR